MRGLVVMTHCEDKGSNFYAMVYILACGIAFATLKLKRLLLMKKYALPAQQAVVGHALGGLWAPGKPSTEVSLCHAFLLW